MEELIEATTVKAPAAVDYYIVMVRYGDDYWVAQSTHRLLEDARKVASGSDPANGQYDWRIVRVKGLPVKVANGQV